MRTHRLIRTLVTLSTTALLYACAAPDINRSAETKTVHDASAQTTVVAPMKSTPSTPTSLSKHRVHREAAVAGLSQDAVRHMPYPHVAPSVNTERYGHYDENPVKRAIESPVSTFSIDVDTGAYANVRRFINEGQLPVKDAVRIEELINYFAYDYPSPSDKSKPFSVTTETMTTPWNPETQLLRVALKGYDVPVSELPAANLVFLVDVSGSMNDPKKLPLLVSGLKLLVQKLRNQDRVAIVTYAGAAGTVLDATPGNKKSKIIAALERLQAGGSTNGAGGIHAAYALAQQHFIDGGINRVLLATDGDFNVGVVNFEALKNMIETKRKSGISLTTLGFGTGNYNDHLMEQLADAGNGNYAYIDTLNEAHKVLVSEMSSTLQTIAKDVKVQIEFNPAVVAEYRLVGHENRVLQREDFNNDKVDAGDIGAGHSVTALYEIALVGSNGRHLEPLRYTKEISPNAAKDELALLKLRYKLPAKDTSTLIEQTIKTADTTRSAKQASADFRFAAAVAGFGQLLRGGKYGGDFDYDDVLALARDARGKDEYGYRGEFLSLVTLARTLDGNGRHARAN